MRDTSKIPMAQPQTPIEEVDIRPEAPVNKPGTTARPGPAREPPGATTEEAASPGVPKGQEEAAKTTLVPMTKKPLLAKTTRIVERTPTGVEMEAKAGEAMYTSPFTLRPAAVFLAVDSWQPPDRQGVAFPEIRKGARFVCPYETSLGSLACRLEHGNLRKPTRDNVPVKGEYLLTLSKDGKEVGYMIGEAGETWEDAPRGLFKPQKRQFTQVDPAEEIRKKIFYEGRVGEKIWIKYREFRGDKALPSRTREFTYGLPENVVFSVRGVRVEVLEATVDRIRYKIPK